MTNESWIAVQSAPRHEKRVEAPLAYRGYRCFLPVVKSVRKWSDRSARIDVPLFPSYLFCKVSATAFAPMIATPGVIRLVGAGRLPPAREAPCGRSSRSRSTAARPAPRSATETSFRPESLRHPEPRRRRRISDAEGSYDLASLGLRGCEEIQSGPACERDGARCEARRRLDAGTSWRSRNEADGVVPPQDGSLWIFSQPLRMTVPSRFSR
jgi:hypothetical protein